MEEATRAARQMQEAMTAPARRAASSLGEIWGGVLGASGDSARAARAADIVSYGVELDRLRARYNPLFAAQQQYRASLNDLRNAYKVGAISTTEYDSALAKIKEGFAQRVVAIRKAGDENDKLGKGLHLNVQGMMELRASGVDAFQALAAGMDPLRVAEMEGAQVTGGIVQGVSNFSALASLAFIVAGAVAALTAGLGYMAVQAYQSSQALRDISTSLVLLGENVPKKQIEDWASSLRGAFNLSIPESNEVVKAFANVGKLTLEQRQH